ncbi:hypothetical protein ACO0K9_11755 [Undibacterium sp. Ji50W]|uniref:hypothetical protein n=1 Tax=Undibacterium sp. Ji50W TaxID=3413041 RepID=UPI003BF325C2
MISIRLFLQSATLLISAIASQLSVAAICNGQHLITNVSVEKDILSVTSQAGAIATTSDRGETWIVGQPTGLESPPFWLKTYLSNGTVFQNIKLEEKMIAISKGIEEEFWSKNNYHDLILFSKGHQLFGFRGNMYARNDYIHLDAGQITGSSEDGFSRSITIDITPHTFCQLANDMTNRRNECQHPFHASDEDHGVTGFSAQPNGNFFISTHKDILYLDVTADKWLRIPQPTEWQCTR